MGIFTKRMLASEKPMISVVVPIQNEPPETADAFARFDNPPDSELILADATQGTRGACLARAAALARGEALLFLHADSQAPPGAVASIARAIAGGASAGAFSLAYADAGRALRWIAWWANLRSRLLYLPYGDQGIFCRREAYERAGGFRDLPVCDDVDLVRRLKREGRFVILPEATTTSARRYRERGALTQVLRVWRVVAGYYLGVPPERLARWYYR